MTAIGRQSTMGPRRWIALVAIALGALIVVAGPAAGQRPGPLAERIERLYRRRLGGPEIARRTGASRTYVYAVLRRLRAAEA